MTFSDPSSPEGMDGGVVSGFVVDSLAPGEIVGVGVFKRAGTVGEFVEIIIGRSEGDDVGDDRGESVGVSVFAKGSSVGAA